MALLLSMLVPALSRARELGKKIVCSNNLHQWGLVSFAFSADHDGFMPRAFQLTSGASMPHYINDVSACKTNGQHDDYEEDAWKVYGTPWNILEKYGLTVDIAVCPSQRWLGGWNGNEDDKNVCFMQDGVWYNGWRRYVTQTYMYIGGIRESKDYMDSPTSHNYTSKIPYKRNEKNISGTLLAADAVVSVPGGRHSSPGRTFFLVNHPSNRNSSLPIYQNLLYADGHVDGMSSGYYKESLQEGIRDLDRKNGAWSYRHGWPGWGPYFYWEGSPRE
jgi:hypothetical protein